MRYPLTRLLLATPLALAACDGAESPLAPADTPDTPAVESAAPDYALAAITSPRIAFVSYRSSDHPDIYLMDPQGNNVTRLTSWAGDEVSPAWSYDNKHIAMVRRRLDATNTQHDDIYLMDADGSHKHWAKSYPSSFHITNPSWSPDGSGLVFTVALPGGPYMATLELATGNMAFVLENGQVAKGRQPSYDPTGKSIIFVGEDGKTVRQLSYGEWHVLVWSDTPVGSPRFSPDGKTFAYSRLVGSNPEIFVQTLATSVSKRLTYSSAADQYPSWSPDGSKIAFASRRSGQQQIWTMSSTTGGNLTRITHTTTSETSPAYSH